MAVLARKEVSTGSSPNIDKGQVVIESYHYCQNVSHFRLTMTIWTEHRNPEGRTYWFNTGTKQSVWEKPDDLKTPFERALNQTKWKEYFSGGRKYYYNTESKESKWDMPDELLLLLEKVEKDGKPETAAASTTPATTTAANGPARITAPGFTPVGGLDSSDPMPQLNGTENNAVGPHTGGLPFAPSTVLPARPNLPDDPVIPHNGFATVEEGEKAFTHLLRKAGVDANWTWDQTMRAIITDPLYKALNSLAEKKAAWQKYTDGLKAKEQEEREARLSKLRPAIRNMLKGNPNVFHYTTFPTADKLFAQHPIWQQAKIEAERKLIFEEYVAELKQREVQEARAARTRSVSKVVALFKQLNVDVLTRWRTAHNMLMDSPEWVEDQELQKLPTLDILLAFEDYSRVREREYDEQMRRTEVEKTRKERKAREAFKGLLQDLVNQGIIKARCKWKEVYPNFSKDERYLGILGNPGSNPLELFWDAVDELDQRLDAKIAIAEHAIERCNEKRRASTENGSGDVEMDAEKAPFMVGPNTTEKEFVDVIRAEPDEAVNSLSDEDVHVIFETMFQMALKKQSDERRRAERRQRHLQDDLRYALKKLPEPLDLNLTYEEALPVISVLPEYKAIEDDEGRKAAFAKFVRRQKERIREAASEDGASTTSRKRKEPTRDRDTDRDWERERERDKDRDRDRDRERDRDKDRDRDRERDRDRDRDRDDRDGRSSRRYHRGHDDYEGQARRSSRDHGRSERDRGDRDRDRGKDGDRDRDGYRSKSHRDDKDDRRRRSKERDWEGSPYKKDERERSMSVYKDEPREKRDAHDHEADERVEKRPRLSRDSEPVEAPQGEKPARHEARAETPEEGEI